MKIIKFLIISMHDFHKFFVTSSSVFKVFKIIEIKIYSMFKALFRAIVRKIDRIIIVVKHLKLSY